MQPMPNKFTHQAKKVHILNQESSQLKPGSQPKPSKFTAKYTAQKVHSPGQYISTQSPESSHTKPRQFTARAKKIHSPSPKSSQPKPKSSQPKLISHPKLLKVHSSSPSPPLRRPMAASVDRLKVSMAWTICTRPWKCSVI